jgi:hypothetical protein
MFAYLTCSDLVVANMLTIIHQIYLSNCHKTQSDLGKQKKTVTITLHPYFAALYVSLNEVYSAIKKGKTKTSGITLTCTYLPYAPLRQDMVHALLSSRPHSGLFIEYIQYIYKNIISLLMDWWPSPNMGNLPQFWLLSGGHAAKSHTGRLAGKG